MSKRKAYTGHPALGVDVDRDTWLTPRYILSELETFDLDPCAAEIRPEWVGATHAYTIRDNGLIQPWTGRVFMNPPFSSTSNWLHKHSEHGLGISLVPAMVESEVWNSCVWKKARAILFLRGRVRFCNPDGSATTGCPLRPVCLIAWSADDCRVLFRSHLAGVLLTSWALR